MAAGHSTPLPFWGQSATEDSYGDPMATPACPAGTAWRYFAEGQGTFTHLGAMQTSMPHCTALTEFVGGDPTAGTFGSGRITLTAANGDELWLSQWGTWQIEMTATGPLSMVDLYWTAVGGTGRFASATGDGTGVAVSDIVANTTVGTFTGTITYDSSDRRN
jgi:hypothetical protein